jgi:hypothetical protein
VSKLAPVVFGNGITQNQAMNQADNRRNFADDGRHILGSPQEAISRLAYEEVFSFLNGLERAGLKLSSVKVNDLLSDMVGTREGQDLSPIPLQYDPSIKEHADHMVKMRRYYQWYTELVYSISLNISRVEFQATQDLLNKNVNAVPVVESVRLPLAVRRLMHYDFNCDSERASALPRVISVFRRDFDRGQVLSKLCYLCAADRSIGRRNGTSNWKAQKCQNGFTKPLNC